MKIRILTISLIMLLGSLVAAGAQSKKPIKTTEEVIFEVSLHCENCKNRIEKNVGFDKGVKDLQVDLDKKTVKITYDTRKTDKQALQKSIEKLGYTVAERPNKKQ